MGRPRLQSQRTNDAVIAVVALQDNPGESRHGRSAVRAQSHRHYLALRRIKLGKRRPREASKPVQRLAYLASVATKGRDNIGLNRCIVRARHVEFRAGRNYDAGDGAQIVALSGSKKIIVGHRLP